MFGRRKDNILVVKTDTLAGFVAAEPVFEGIRQRHPDAVISLLTTSSLQRIAKAAPYFDQVAALPNAENQVEKKAFSKQLKAAKFSRVFDLSANDSSKFVQNALGPFGPKWFSVSPPARKPKTKSLAAMHPNPEKLCQASGVELPMRQPNFGWALASRKDSANMQPSWFGISGAYGLLAPGADEARRWPAEQYGALARLCVQNGVMPVLIGGQGLHVFGDLICEVTPEIVDLTGKTDHLQLAALAKEAQFFVTDAAEEAQLAAAVGAAGVLIKRRGEEALSPEGRHVITLTGQGDLSEVEARFVWQALNNMGLINAGHPQTFAAAR